MSRSRPAFSLVELIIVVVIIGVIAAIAIPRISRGSSGASAAALRSSLQTLRTAIDMYAGEHDGVFPASSPAEARNEATFIGQLTERTNLSGEVGTTSGGHIYGPYLRQVPPIPVGPNVGASGVIHKTNGVVFEDQPAVGWVYNFETGDIYANTDDLDENGVGYDTY